jgi:hypothetical protein
VLMGANVRTAFVLVRLLWRIYFGSWFQRFQSILLGFIESGPFWRQNHHGSQRM